MGKCRYTSTNSLAGEQVDYKQSTKCKISLNFAYKLDIFLLLVLPLYLGSCKSLLPCVEYRNSEALIVSHKVYSALC